MKPRIAMWLLAVCALTESVSAQTAAEIQIQESQFETLGIATALVEPAGAVRGARLPARVVVPPSQVQVVSAPQAGLLDSLQVAVGEEVRSGQELARIQSPELLALQRDYLQSVTQLHLAGSELRRDQDLLKEGIIAKRRLLEKESRYAEVAANRDQQRQALRLAGMDSDAIQGLAKTRKLSSVLSVRSPMDGTVMETMVSAGQRVELTEPLYRLADLDRLWLEIRAPVDAVASLQLGLTVEVEDLPVRGQLLLIAREVDPDSQTVLLRAEVTEGGAHVRPGQFIQARIAAAGIPGLSVASSALVRSADAIYVFVRTDQGFRAVPVDCLSEQGGRAVVQGNLQVDDRVAVRGVSAIKAAWLGLGGGE